MDRSGITVHRNADSTHCFGIYYRGFSTPSELWKMVFSREMGAHFLAVLDFLICSAELSDFPIAVDCFLVKPLVLLYNK